MNYTNVCVCVWIFSPNNVFEVHPCSGTYLYVVPSNGLFLYHTGSWLLQDWLLQKSIVVIKGPGSFQFSDILIW